MHALSLFLVDVPADGRGDDDNVLGVSEMWVLCLGIFILAKMTPL